MGRGALGSPHINAQALYNSPSPDVSFLPAPESFPHWLTPFEVLKTRGTKPAAIPGCSQTAPQHPSAR